MSWLTQLLCAHFNQDVQVVFIGRPGRATVTVSCSDCDKTLHCFIRVPTSVVRVNP